MKGAYQDTKYGICCFELTRRSSPCPRRGVEAVLEFLQLGHLLPQIFHRTTDGGGLPQIRRPAPNVGGMRRRKTCVLESNNSGRQAWATPLCRGDFSVTAVLSRRGGGATRRLPRAREGFRDNREFWRGVSDGATWRGATGRVARRGICG